MRSFCRTFTLAALCSVTLFVTVHAQKSTAADNQRADAILAKMTLEEKIDLLSGSGLFNSRPIPRVGIPAFYMSDGPVGAHVPPPSTALAAGIGLAASFDTQLAEQVGTQIGRDARSRGAAYLLGPGVNIYRAPMNGRNFEYFGEDPFLAAKIDVGYILGIQSQNVAATIKHYAGNNSEYARDTSNTIVGERALREIYFVPFEAGVKEAHVGAVMDSYNLLNGLHATQSPYLNIEVLRKDWGFDGVLMSDWGAVHTAVDCVNSGLDLEMPFGEFMNRKNLLPAVKNGQVSVATIDEHVRRILRVAARFGWLDHDQTDLNIPRYDQPARIVALRGALEEAVLLKNENHFLPLDRAQQTRIAVLGPDAWPAVGTGGGSGAVLPFSQVSIMEGISDNLGIAGNVTYARAVPSVNQVAESTRWTTAADGKVRGVVSESFDNDAFTGTPLSSSVDKNMESGEPTPTDPEKVDALLHMTQQDFAGFLHAPAKPSFHRWTAYYDAPATGMYDMVVLDGVQFRLLVDGKPAIDNSIINRAALNQAAVQLSAGPHKVEFEQLHSAVFGASTIRVGIMQQGHWVADYAKQLAAKADVVVLALGFDNLSETEGADREFALPAGQEELIREITAVNKNVVVSLTCGGSVDVGPWIDSVPAVIENWYPGQEGGSAFASILFGDVSPSGRLPISWEKKITDNPSYSSYYPRPGTLDIDYTNGIWVGYRGFDHNHTQPLFPFGYGLSYTTFAYSNLTVRRNATGSELYTAAFDVKNTGSKQSAEVAQLYIAPPAGKVERPEKELKGFARVELAPGETRHVEIPLTARSFTYFDVAGKAWHADAGTYMVRVGHDSADTPLAEKLTLEEPISVSIEESRP
jgi:beta-glucosidase